MKYHQIEAFYQVMLTGSISQAAKNLGRTQPAVSMTIASLENDLSTTLFDRHAGRIAPRVEAKVLFEQVSLVMQQLRDIRTRFNRIDPLPMPRISIIAASNAVVSLVPGAIADLAQGGQEFRIMNGSAATIISEMENQRHDIGVTDRGVSDIDSGSPLFSAEAFHVPVYAIFRRGMFKESLTSLSVDDLAGQRICALYAENPSSNDIRSQLPPPHVEFESFFPMACYAVANDAVAIADLITCSAMRAVTNGGTVVDYRPIRGAAPSSYYLLRSRYRPRSEMIDRCHDAVRQALAAHRVADAV